MVSSSLQFILLAAATPSALSFISDISSNFRTAQFAKPPGDDKVWSVDEAKMTTGTTPVEFKFPNPFAEIADIFQNFDDVIDDFFNKRMGNGEIFYGKRKYKPSGKVESGYEGGGFSDWRKMEAAREFREERARLKEEEKARNGVEQ
ncbi:hypothetical protein ACHAWO_010145 [Cyclotella atomus]|uniref:Uncharacterized protein n=1 Tax=Cyclotella atomus TaxID=382360 RepID=A0ABD3Q6Q9_9STRA